MFPYSAIINNFYLEPSTTGSAVSNLAYPFALVGRSGPINQTGSREGKHFLFSLYKSAFTNRNIPQVIKRLFVLPYKSNTATVHTPTPLLSHPPPLLPPPPPIQKSVTIKNA